MWKVTIEAEDGTELFSESTTDMHDIVSCTEHLEKMNLLSETDGCGNPLIIRAATGKIWNHGALIDSIELPIQDDTWSTVLVTVTDSDADC